MLQGLPVGTLVQIQVGTGAVTFGRFSDQRLNAQDMAQTVTAYCGTGKLDVYKLVKGQGVFLFSITTADIVSAQAKIDAQISSNQTPTNQLMRDVEGRQAWLLTSHEVALIDSASGYHFVVSTAACGLVAAH